MSSGRTAPPPAVGGLSDPRAILARHGASFHFASRFMGRERAFDCARLYAFCRHLDDLVDEAHDKGAAAAELDRIAADITRGRSALPGVADFLDLAARYGLETQAVADLIDGLRFDCGMVRIRDEQDLLRYAYRVAGTVGRLIAPILGCRNRLGLAHAIDLGVAMQLTNIARDVREDAARDRTYLPSSWIDGYPARSLLEPNNAIRLRVALAIERLLVLADRYYTSAEAGLGYLPLSVRPAILIAARTYRAIGTELRGGRPPWWAGRARVGTRDKCRVAVIAALPRLCRWGSQPRHDGALHAAFAGIAMRSV
jgi:phytoene synthase